MFDNGEDDRQAAGTPVEHVRTHCPTLIATLVAIAREAQEQVTKGADGERS
jgi:hypothetical protein